MRHHHRLTFMDGSDRARGRETMKYLTERRTQIRRLNTEITIAQDKHHRYHCQGPGCHCEQPR